MFLNLKLTHFKTLKPVILVKTVKTLDGWVCGYMDGWVGGRMDAWMCGWVDGCTDGSMGGWVNRWMDEVLNTL